MKKHVIQIQFWKMRFVSIQSDHICATVLQAGIELGQLVLTEMNA